MIIFFIIQSIIFLFVFKVILMLYNTRQPIFRLLHNSIVQFIQTLILVEILVLLLLKLHLIWRLPIYLIHLFNHTFKFSIKFPTFDFTFFDKPYIFIHSLFQHNARIISLILSLLQIILINLLFSNLYMACWWSFSGRILKSPAILNSLQYLTLMMNGYITIYLYI